MNGRVQVVDKVNKDLTKKQSSDVFFFSFHITKKIITVKSFDQNVNLQLLQVYLGFQDVYITVNLRSCTEEKL